MESFGTDILSNNDEVSELNYLNNFTEILDQIIQQIDKIIFDTEKNFLEIGNNLQQNYKVTKEVTGSASSAAQMFAGGKMLQNINQLNDIVEKSSSYLSNSMKGIESGGNILKEVLNILNRAIDNLGGFGRIVKHLRMLGISTKIESARLNIEDSGFTAIADNVEKLSSIIHDKSNDIREKAYFLIKTIGNAQSNILHLENRQQEQSSIIINNTKTSFDALLSKYNMYSEKAQIISSISGKVSENINEIVSSIQTHDIMRQQLEHIKNALAEVQKKIKSELLNNNNGGSIQNTFYAVFDICDLQSKQLNHSRNEFVKAIVSISQSISNIDNSIAELSGYIMEISGFEFSDGSFITEIEKGLKHTAQELQNNNNVNSELTSSMKSVADTVGNLNSYVHEIDEIGTEVEMIALNARVKAAHTGSEGAALGVLAESIQRLSADARIHTTQVSEILTLIMKSAEDLKANSGSDSLKIRNDEIQDLNYSIEQLLANLNEIEKNAVTVINNTKNSIFHVKDSINNITANLEMKDSINDSIADVNSKIEEITGSIRKLYAKSGSNRDKNVNIFRDRYTTSGERTIHDRMVKGSTISETKSLTKNPNSLSELGDNIELF